ncbi:hypothetical protein BJX64DRAFT_293904 [Aspergillus heterothallicus]
MSCSPGGSDRRPTSPGESEQKRAEEHEPVVKERVATRCNRINPCAHCVKSGAQCSFRLGHKVQEKRQRVLISSVYEKRLEHISNKIDELGSVIEQLRDERRCEVPRIPVARSLPTSSLESRYQRLSETEAIEPSLFSHAIRALEALQAALIDEQYYTVATDIASALDAAWDMINVQKQRNEALERSRPFPNVLTPSLTFRDLPLPSVDKIMACLRIAQDSSPSRLYWPFEFGTLPDFTQYVIKACSPGLISDMELIIVHFTLHGLFTQCSIQATDDEIRQDYESQALICQESLETILSHLPFHIDTNIDSITALYMATLHCLGHGKTFTAWTFIARAALMCQAMGLNNSHIIAVERVEEGQRKLRLFWAVYALEKAVSLRLGRSSTIKDRDITVPRLALDRTMTSVPFNRFPDWIELASLYGRMHDDLYSPAALAQSTEIRMSRTRALASELEQLIMRRAEYYAFPQQWSSPSMYPTMSTFFIHANRAIEHSTLASVYRGIPSETPYRLAPCNNCIAAARISLQESEACVEILLSKAATWPTSLDSWINEILLLAPFIPFMILVCTIVEARDALGDLAHLRRVVGGLRTLAQSPRYRGCNRQLHIFDALYNVASKYVDLKTSAQPVDTIDYLLSDLCDYSYPNAGFDPSSELMLGSA